MIRFVLASGALVLALITTTSCSRPRSRTDIAVRWLKPGEVGPHGSAPRAAHRIVGGRTGATTEFVLVLSEGDEVATALHDLAVAEHLQDAHFVAIGGVRDPEFAWFDPARHEFKAMTLPQQVEVLALTGDIVIGADGTPVVHAHAVFGLDDGRAWGGHLIHATTSPTLEVYVTALPTPLFKRADPDGLQRIDPTLDRGVNPS